MAGTVADIMAAMEVDMVANIVADMVAAMIADMKVNMVADMIANMVKIEVGAHWAPRLLFHNIIFFLPVCFHLFVCC